MYFGDFFIGKNVLNKRVFAKKATKEGQGFLPVIFEKQPAGG